MILTFFLAKMLMVTASLSSAFLPDFIQTLKKICLLFGSPCTGGETGACSVASSDAMTSDDGLSCDFRHPLILSMLIFIVYSNICSLTQVVMI